MSFTKPSRAEVLQNVIENRRLLVSYKPENYPVNKDKATIKDWSEQFSMRLNLKNREFSTVISANAGVHKDEIERISGSYTDFLVVFTTYYANTPPSVFDKVAAELNDVGNKTSLLMWLAKYDPDDINDSILYEKCRCWHVLSGKGHEGRFREIEEQGWRDDLSDAAKAIHNHPSCNQKSDICPKFVQTGNPGENDKQQSFVSSLLGFFHKEPDKHEERN